jgi:zinc transport system permease protein
MNIMTEFLSYGFLQRALLAGIFVAIACAILGVFLILRRDSMIGHGLAHVTFAGIAIGLLLNVVPLAAATFVAVITALGIMKLKERAGLYGDTAIAIFSSVGFAVGILIVSLSQGFNIDLFGYLFGDILAIDAFEVSFSVGLALVVVIIVTAITVVLGMKIVGLLLVAALLVIPAAAGLQIASNFKQAIILSSIISLVSVIFGLVVAFTLDLPASGTIVCFSFFFFLIFFFVKRDRRFF